MKNSFRAQTVVRKHHFHLDLQPQEALAYFTPEGERSWAEGWEPTFLHPADGKTQQGMVFTTEHGGEHTIWTLTDYDWEGRRVEYVRATPGSRVGIVCVTCHPHGELTCRVEVNYTITALTEAGNETLAGLTEDKFAEYIASWKSSIEDARSKAMA